MNKYLLITLLASTSIIAYASNFNVINETELVDISDDETGLHPDVLANLESSNYIKPNERNPNFYVNFLANRTGTLLSVGTFRTVIAFTAGQFDRLIMVDVAKSILNFNRAHLSYIKDLSCHGSFTEQREKYAQTYRKYLNVFEKSGFLYYWQSDEKWEKLVGAIREDRIHVIRGNFGAVSSNARLLHVLSELKTNITLDHSNLLQYVSNEKTKYAQTIEAFAHAAHDNNFAILATIQSHSQRYDLWPFAIGCDPALEKDDGIQWVYHYFPIGRAYLNFIDPHFYDVNRIGEIELEEWQEAKVVSQVHGLMLENIQKSNERLAEDAESFLNGRASLSDHMKWTPSVRIADASKAKVWRGVFLLSKTLFAQLLPQAVYEKLISHEDCGDHKEAAMKFFSAYRDEINRPLKEFFEDAQLRAQDFYDAKVREYLATLGGEQS